MLHGDSEAFGGDLELHYENWAHDPASYLCAAVLVVTGSLAAAAGIGGGGIIVAVLMFCGGMAPHDAVPMSKAVVFAGVLVSSGMNLYKGTAAKGQPLVDLDIVAAVVPLALAGTLCGVWLNSRVSATVIVVALTITLLAMIASCLVKLLEEVQNEFAEQPEPRVNPQEGGATPGADAQETSILRGEKAPLSVFGQSEEQDAQTRKQRVLVVALSILLTAVILGGVLHKHMMDCHTKLRGGAPPECESALLRGLMGSNHAFLAGPHGSGIASFPILMSLICCVLFFAANTMGCLARQPDRESTLKYSAMGFFAGNLAGLVGIGGGLIFSPFMLWSGVDPHVAVATSTFCVIFTATSTTLQYGLMGRIFLPLAILYGACNQISSYGGTRLMHKVQDLFPMKKSIPTGIVLLAVAISAVLTILKLHVIMKNQSELPSFLALHVAN